MTDTSDQEKIEQLQARVDELEKENTGLRRINDYLFRRFTEALVALGATEETVNRVRQMVIAGTLGQGGER